jgi:hypothetical protein
MFDELYNKAKKHLVPEDGKTLPQKEVSAKKPIEEKKETVVLPTAPTQTTAPPVIDKSNVAQTTLTKEEQTALLEKRKHTPGWILLLKYGSIFLLITGVIGILWFKADLERTNKYLSVLSAIDNTGSKHERFGKLQKKLEQESLKTTGKIARVQQQLETKNYSVFTENIKNIRDQQLLWFDSTENGTLSYGILDGPHRATKYFNADTYTDPILSNTGNQVTIGDISANRENIGFGVNGSHLFGKAFFLNTEFVSLMNAFPIYKGGSLNSFTKKKDSNGNQSMNFVLQIQLQSKEDIDLNDTAFIKYETWNQENSFPKTQ